MVACYRNTTDNNCTWVRSSQNIDIEYDIWMVNGDPASKQQNPFEHQFSFEDHDLVESYAVFFTIYLILIPIWIYAYIKQKHMITKILTVSISLELTGIALNLLHYIIFSSNGVGFYVISIIGNAIDAISECMFMLTLLLIARGWTIISLEFTGRAIVVSIWGFYTLLNCILFVWNLVSLIFCYTCTVLYLYRHAFCESGTWIMYMYKCTFSYFSIHMLKKILGLFHGPSIN